MVSAQLRTKCPCTMETLSPSRAATESSAFTKCPVPSTIGILCDGSAVTPYRRILFTNATRTSVHVMSLTSLAMYLGPSNTSSVSVCWHQMHLGLWPEAPLNYARDGAGLLGVSGRCSGGLSNSRTFFALVVPISLRGLSQRLLCATSLRKEIEYTGACIVL